MALNTGRKRINLIAGEFSPKMEFKQEFVSLGTAAFLAVLSLFFFVHDELASRRAKTALDALQAEHHVVLSQMVAQADKSAKAAQQSAKITSIQSVLSKKAYWADMFKELTQLMPDGVWLTQLSTQPQGAFTAQLAAMFGATPGTRVLTLKGEATSQEKVAQFFAVLEKSYYFRHLAIKTAEREEDLSPNLYSFEFSIPVTEEKGGKI